MHCISDYNSIRRIGHRCCEAKERTSKKLEHFVDKHGRRGPSYGRFKHVATCYRWCINSPPPLVSQICLLDFLNSSMTFCVVFSSLEWILICVVDYSFVQMVRLVLISKRSLGHWYDSSSSEVGCLTIGQVFRLSTWQPRSKQSAIRKMSLHFRQ